MGNACCGDGRDKDNVDNLKSIKAIRPMKIVPVEENITTFESSINNSYLKLPDPVKNLVAKHGLYKFENSAADLKGSETNPLKMGENEEYVYHGQFLGNKMHGKGHLLDKQGNLIVAPFFDGVAKGTGAIYFSNGNYYFGRLANTDMDNGKMVYPDGTVYTGDFKSGKRDGRGTFTYPDGSKYEGAWKNDVENGVGRLIIDGTWVNGKRATTALPPGAAPVSTTPHNAVANTPANHFKPLSLGEKETKPPAPKVAM